MKSIIDSSDRKPIKEHKKTPAPYVPEHKNITVKASHKYTSIEGLSQDKINEYFSEILLTEFPEYAIRKNVCVTELVGNANDSFKLYQHRPYQSYKAEWGQPYTFVIYKDGVVKGVVMLGDKRSHGEKVKYLISRMYAKKLEIPYISFYTHLPNHIEYVIMRINKFLKQ